ncbi:Na+-transporting methylmalonyl-CoA/oxaloacetate decarboxylase gamma subunit [Salirhabdus euzebyi]|nr:Na+-transporting methylmalonyl-CoA/oxaloacetate decarboxylase gamma subunit [Salirhabdus euzebyi]
MKRYFLVLGILIVALTACSNETKTETGHAHQEKNTSTALSYNIETDEWPPDVATFFQDEANHDVKEAYEIAIHHPELLSMMPCYCGCGEDGHTSNHDCFVDSRDNEIVYLDSMGFG